MSDFADGTQAYIDAFRKAGTDPGAAPDRLNPEQAKGWQAMHFLGSRIGSGGTAQPHAHTVTFPPTNTSTV